MDQKKKLIVGGVVAVIVVVGLIWLLSKPNILIANEPKFELKDLHNMAPVDGSVLVAFQGFAKYLSSKYGKKQYLALAPVTRIQVSGGKTFQDVRVDSAYGSVSLGVWEDVKDKFHIKNITIETNDGDAEKSCHVEDAQIYYSDQMHYECDQPLPAMSCVRSVMDKYGRWDQVKVAELTISAVRLETIGKLDDHEKGKFTFDKEVCKKV